MIRMSNYIERMIYLFLLIHSELLVEEHCSLHLYGLRYGILFVGDYAEVFRAIFFRAPLQDNSIARARVFIRDITDQDANESKGQPIFLLLRSSSTKELLH
jgi:hypothetical protein